MSLSGKNEQTDKKLWEISLRVVLVPLFIALLYLLYTLFTGGFRALIEEWDRYLWIGSLVFLSCIGFTVFVILWDRHFRSLPPEEKPDFGTFFKDRPLDVPITPEEVYVEISEILKRYVPGVEVTADTALFHDLWLYGDDIDEFLEEVSVRFDIREPLLDGSDYFPGEGELLRPLWLFKAKNREKWKVMTVGELSGLIFQGLREKHRESDWSFEIEN